MRKAPHSVRSVPDGAGGCIFAGRSPGFTLVEVLVATTVFLLLLALLALVNEQSLRLLQSSRSQAEAFQSGRIALDQIARRVSQATLNPYWALDDPFEPTRYLRQSRMRFLTAPSSDLLGPSVGPGSAIFFQAPLGRSSDSDNRNLGMALNTCGFFVQRGEDANHPSVEGLPPALTRYRLMELRSTAEEMEVFSSTGPEDHQWFTNLVASGAARPLADNVVLLVFRAMRDFGSPLGEDLTTGYIYDSAENVMVDPQPPTANQLPPFLEITLVAVDDASYARAGEPILDFDGLFREVQHFDRDLREVEEEMQEAGLDFRVFQTRVALTNSKWSEE